MTIMSELPNYINSYLLSNLDIYKVKLKENIDIILEKYLNLVNNYNNLFFKNIKINDKKYFKYLLLNGLKTVSRVFIFILMYTRNLEAAYFHSEKSYYIYIEFVSQIDNHNHSYLQLNGKDASLFVYKKTIFDIDSNIKKDYICKEKDKLDILNYFLEILLRLLNFYYQEDYQEDLEEDLDEDLEKYKLNLQNNKKNNLNILDSIISLFSLKLFSLENNIKYTKLVIEFIDLFLSHLFIYFKDSKDKVEKIQIYLDILFIKLKKYKIHNNILDKIKRLNSKDIINKTPKKFIDFLIEDSKN
jgi:hypothetical protein